MTKLADEWLADGDKIIHKRTFDFTGAIERVTEIKSHGVIGMGNGADNKLVGSIPMWLLNEWIKEAGLTWDDNEAVQDMMRKKLLSGDFNKLRAWEGTF